MKISIITPSYNSGKYIKRAIESVLKQDYYNIEHIIIDGGSNDKTLRILKSYPHLKWISEPDKGQSDAMNKGYALATGEIIVYLNSDDSFEPNIFSRVISEFKKGVDIVIGNIKVRYDNGNTEILKPSKKHKDILEYWSKLYPINPLQYFYKKELQKGIQFNLNNSFSMDHEFLIDITYRQEIQHLGISFGTFYMNSDSKTVKGMSDPGKYWDLSNFNYTKRIAKKYGSNYFKSFQDKQNSFHKIKLNEDIFVESLIRKVKNLGIRRLCVYGTGNLSRIFSRKASLRNILVESFIDSKANEKNLYFMNKKVITPTTSIENGSRIFLIASNKFKDEMVDNLLTISKSKRIQIELIHN